MSLFLLSRSSFTEVDSTAVLALSSMAKVRKHLISTANTSGCGDTNNHHYCLGHARKRSAQDAVTRARRSYARMAQLRTQGAVTHAGRSYARRTQLRAQDADTPAGRCYARRAQLRGQDAVAHAERSYARKTRTAPSLLIAINSTAVMRVDYSANTLNTEMMCI